MVLLAPCKFAILAQHRLRERAYVVLGRRTQRLRFSVQIVPTRSTSCIILAQDGLLALRARALAAYAGLNHRPDSDHAAPFAPSAYRRGTLIRHIQIADALSGGATCRDIAYSIVFPHHQPVSGATWKGSSERRHCWRMIQKTRWYLQGGYRHLLFGC